MADKIRFTPSRLATLQPPATGERSWTDTVVPLLSVRAQAGSPPKFCVRYRFGGSAPRRIVLGDVRALPLDDARKLAQDIATKLAAGIDPRAEAETKSGESGSSLTLAELIDQHEVFQKARSIVSAAEAARSLRRELAPLLPRDPATLTRRDFVAQMAPMLVTRQGSYKTLQARLHGVLGWACNEGHIPANVMAGYRAPRQSKAQIVAEGGRHEKGTMLDMAEIAALWKACDDRDAVTENFGAYVRLLILTGCRRKEMVEACWSWLRPAREDMPPLLMIPPAQTKNGREHAVVLPPLAQTVIASLRRLPGTPLMLPGRHVIELGRGKGAPSPAPRMTGWSKTWPRLLKAAKAHGLTRHVTLHDLRRTFRSHLGRLGVSTEIAELMLNHTPANVLVATYDKHAYLDKRAEAAALWCDAVSAALDKPAPAAGAAVIQLRRGEGKRPRRAPAKAAQA